MEQYDDLLLALSDAGMPLSQEDRDRIGERAGAPPPDRAQDIDRPGLIMDGRQHLWLTPQQARAARERSENPQPRAECYLDRIPQAWKDEWRDREISRDDWCPMDAKTLARNDEFRAFHLSHIPRFDRIAPYEPFWLFIEQALRWLAEDTSLYDVRAEDRYAFVQEEFRRMDENHLYGALKYGYIPDDSMPGGVRKYDASTPQALILYWCAVGLSGELFKGRQSAVTSTFELDEAISILTTPSSSAVLVTDDVKYTGEKIFKQKFKSMISLMVDRNPWMDADKWLWSASSVTATWTERDRKGASNAMSAERTVAASGDTQVINGTNVSRIKIDEAQNVGPYSGIKREVRPAMVSFVDGVARIKRSLWAYGTGNAKNSGSEFTSEYKATMEAFRKGRDTSTYVPGFFDWTCRPGMTEKDLIEEYDFFMNASEGDMASRSSEERLAMFYSAHPNKPEDAYLTLHRHVVPVTVIAEAWELIERHCTKRGIPVLGHFDPVFNTSVPMAEGSWYPHLVVGSKWVPHAPDSLNSPCRMFLPKKSAERWVYRWAQGTDPAVVGSGSSMFASAIFDGAGAWRDRDGARTFNPTVACLLNDSKQNMEECFNQSILMGMYYANDGQGACPELVEANRGGEYTRWKSSSMFNLSRSLLYRTQMPPKYQGGGHLYGIDMKNNDRNGRKTELFFDIVAFIRQYGPRADESGKKRLLNIWYYDYWTQLYNIEVDEQATGAIKFGTRSKNLYNDDIVYAVQYANIAHTVYAGAHTPMMINTHAPEFRVVRKPVRDMNTLEVRYEEVREPVIYV
ncbi:MAG TPA: hypothetical protein PL106_00980 [Flavobacteriales bacterium]|nr:hypothetical protein [Flavobacteriales bacterium]